MPAARLQPPLALTLTMQGPRQLGPPLASLPSPTQGTLRRAAPCHLSLSTLDAMQWVLTASRTLGSKERTASCLAMTLARAAGQVLVAAVPL